MQTPTPALVASLIAYDLGRIAFWTGQSIGDNPLAEAPLANSWRDGLLDAEQTSIAGRDVRIRRPNDDSALPPFAREARARSRAALAAKRRQP